MQGSFRQYNYSFPKHFVHEFRWDKGNLCEHYAYTGELLSKVDHNLTSGECRVAVLGQCSFLSVSMS